MFAFKCPVLGLIKVENCRFDKLSFNNFFSINCRLINCRSIDCRFDNLSVRQTVVR